MSKTLIRILIASVIMAVTLSTSVGYAVLSDELNISGENNANKQSGIFITDAKIASNVGADLTNSSVTQNGGCILTVNSALSETNTSSTLTYAVTFYNSTNDYYVYYTDSSSRTNDTFITYTVSGITKKKTIAPPRSYITCTIIYKYTKDPTTSNVNSSDGIINFTFTKCYKVTYENFSSTSGFQTYANPYQDFEVTLDNNIPVAVDVNGSNLTFNNFSMSNKTLTVAKSKVTGNIHVRKKTKKTYNNMIKNGSFENSALVTGDATTGWIYNSDSQYWGKIDSAMGSNAARKNICAYNNQHLKQRVTLYENNIYYFYFHAMSHSGTQNVYSDIAKDGVSATGTVSVSAVTGANGGYKRGSSRFTVDTKSSWYYVNLAWNTNSTSIHLDGVGVVNLTEIFGSGNEPSKDWCDQWINVHDNSKINTYV